MNRIIIGLCGKKCCGKSTFGNYMKNNYNFNIYSFGESLKKALQDIFFFTDEEVNGNKKEVINEYWGITPREVMQYFGTELMREQFGNKFSNIQDKIWIKSLQYKLINDITNNHIDKIIIDDVRFNNEIDFIKDFGLKHNFKTYIIHIYNDETNNNINNFSEHKSENENLNYDLELFNDKSNFSNFYNSINHLVFKF